MYTQTYTHTRTRTHRVIHSFTAAGILPSQYTNLSRFAGLGTVGGGYITQGW